jgi:HPt (histidine-containing phosphotransfer) domain-containing protein
MTAHAMAGDADRFLAAGMDDYLAKPVTLRKLEKMLRTWLSVEDAPAETPVSPGVDEDRGEIIDFAWLTSMIGEDDPAALAELLGIFVEDFPSLLRAVSEALGHADRTALARAAHACKSAASSAAAKALTAIMLQLEHTAATADLGDLQQGLAAADQEFHRVTAEIAKLSAAG